MIFRKWIVALALPVIIGASLTGCNSAPAEKTPAEVEEIRKEQVNRSNRERGIE
jgi:hypothetical protein